MVFVCIGILLIGILLLLKPEVLWKLKTFMNTDDGEPSDYFITSTKATGGLLIGVSIFLFIIFVL